MWSLLQGLEVKGVWEGNEAGAMECGRAWLFGAVGRSVRKGRVRCWMPYMVSSVGQDRNGDDSNFKLVILLINILNITIRVTSM